MPHVVLITIHEPTQPMRSEAAPGAPGLAQLLSLNLTVAQRIASDQSVTAPGIPPDYPQGERLVTKDCVRP